MRALPLIVIVLVGVLLATHSEKPGPTPEQQAIATLQRQVEDLIAKTQNDPELIKRLQQDLDKIQQIPSAVESPKPLPFADAYPAQAKTLEELNTAVNRCVETCTKTSIEIESLKASMKKVEDFQATCPACEPKKATTITLPTSEYSTAIATAEATNRKVLFVLRQEVCRYCDELEMNVTHQPYFQDEISRNYVLSEINITRDTESAKHFTVPQTPAVLIYNPKTKIWRTMLTVPRNIPAFLATLKGM